MGNILIEKSENDLVLRLNREEVRNAVKTYATIGEIRDENNLIVPGREE